MIEDDRVMTFAEWCELNGFSASTGQRVIASGKGPRFIQLSARRKGVTIGENRRWQKSCMQADPRLRAALSPLK
jgi:predicted DNA-binding transcriptional regulator AlpA